MTEGAQLVSRSDRSAQIQAALARETEGMSEKERLAYMLDALARAMARRNPDAAEMFGDALGTAARAEKVDHIDGLGVVTRISLFAGTLEMRGGELDRYIDGEPPGDGYEEVVIPLG